jgi:hypothetical protein
MSSKICLDSLLLKQKPYAPQNLLTLCLMIPSFVTIDLAVLTPIPRGQCRLKCTQTCSQNASLLCPFPTMGSCNIHNWLRQSCISSSVVKFRPFRAREFLVNEAMAGISLRQCHFQGTGEGRFGAGRGQPPCQPRDLQGAIA